MDKAIAGLLGAAAALGAMSAAQAKPLEPAMLPPATSYADLLQPVPNALALQKADDGRRDANHSSEDVKLARWYGREHHHHHHHHRYYGPRFYGYYGHYPRYRYRYHHHHHHHRYYRYRW